MNLLGSLKTLNLHTITSAFIYQIAGMNSHMFHLVSILTHLVNIVLVYGFVVSMFKEDVAKLTAILFALHPVNAEAVMWISGAPYAILTTFILLVFIPFVLYEKTHNIKYFLASVIIFLVTVLNDKGAWPLVIPAIILIVDQLVFSNKIDVKRGILLVLPFFIIAGASAYIIVGKNYHNRAEDLTKQYYFNPSEASPLLNRLPITVYSGIKNLVFPYELNIYPGEKTITLGFYKWMSFVTILFGITILYLYKNNRIYAGLILAIIASIGPTLSPIQIAWLMTERYLYTGSVFFAILLALLLINAQKKNNSVFKAVTIGLVSLYILRILLRTEDWRTNKNLWISTLRFSPESYRVYNNLGDVYMKEKSYDKAIENFKKSFGIFPGYADAMHNAGLAYMIKQDFENAKKYMNMAITTKPELVPAWEKLGVIYFQEKQYEISRAYFTKALELDPNTELSKIGLQAISEELSKGN